MLKALYDYAIRHDLTLPAGYVKKTIKAYVSLSSVDPDYVGIRIGDEEAIPCPDIGSLANGTDKSNVLVEKRSVVIPEVSTSKSDFFRKALDSCGEQVPAVKICAEALQNETLLEKIRTELDRHKIKGSDRVSFRVDNRMILDMDGILDWWQTFRRQFSEKNVALKAPCVITGELIEPVATVPPISGLHAVGGHARGDALICFDKNAFCSYGLKQAANAPVSESAIGAVKAALDALLEDAPILAGMKFVHWYDVDIPKEKDPVLSDDFFGFEGMEAEDESEESAQVTEQEEHDARRSADRMLGSVTSGLETLPLNANYHILLLSGVGGRVMVRRYERGRYEKLQENLSVWQKDLRLINPVGTSLLRSQKLITRLGRLLKYQKTDKKYFDRLDKELSGLTPAILTAILNRTELPDAVAVRALAYVRSMLFTDANDDNKKDNNLDGWACQWLKAWLLRKERKNGNEETIMETYNMNHPDPAYHCGGIMAVYAAIQQTADPNVNVNVVQRYYASAIQAPSLVLGRLSQLSVHHQEKIKNEGTVFYYKKLLGECSVAIGNRIPTTLNLVEQSYFALGYYQMQARLTHERLERAAAKRERNETNQETEE